MGKTIRKVADDLGINRQTPYAMPLRNGEDATSQS